MENQLKELILELRKQINALNDVIYSLNKQNRELDLKYHIGERSALIYARNKIEEILNGKTKKE